MADTPATRRSWAISIARFIWAVRAGPAGFGRLPQGDRDAEQALLPDNIQARIREISDFMGIGHGCTGTQCDHCRMTLDTLDRELRDLTEQFPERKNSIVSAGVEQRGQARSTLKYLVLSLHQINSAMRSGISTRRPQTWRILVKCCQRQCRCSRRASPGPCSIDKFMTRISRPCASCTGRHRPALAPRRRYDPTDDVISCTSHPGPSMKTTSAITLLWWGHS